MAIQQGGSFSSCYALSNRYKKSSQVVNFRVSMSQLLMSSHYVSLLLLLKLGGITTAVRIVSIYGCNLRACSVIVYTMNCKMV